MTWYKFSRLGNVQFIVVLLCFSAGVVCNTSLAVQQDDELPLVLETSDDEIEVGDVAAAEVPVEVPSESVPVASDDADLVTPVSEQTNETFANDQITSDDAYRQLVAGNARYLKQDSETAKELPRLSTQENRFPIATIIYSSDMPILPTTLTQTTDHDVYLTSVKVGAISTEEIASIEYGLLNLQTPLLVVVGHYPSRDVSNLIRDYDALEAQAKAESSKITASGNMTIPEGITSDEMKLYNLAGPAIARSKEAYPDLQGYELANVVSEAIVWQSMETILMKSTVAQDLVRSGKLQVVAAIADDQTGKIFWLGSHPLQEEFLKPVPEELRDVEESNEIVQEDQLPAAIDDACVQEYVTQYEYNSYYTDVVDEYYTEPIYYVPSWQLFYNRVWTYRPWYGVWVDSFTPWPYWSPWGYPPGIGGLGLSISNHHLSFFIGYNRYWGYRPWDPGFRPYAPWWNLDIFIDLGHRHRHDPIYDMIWGGRRGDVPHVPFAERPLYRHGNPPGSRPHDGGPGAGRPEPRFPGNQPGRPGGAFDPKYPRGSFDQPRNPRPDAPDNNRRNYRPGDARPGGGSGERMGNRPISSALGFGRDGGSSRTGRPLEDAIRNRFRDHSDRPGQPGDRPQNGVPQGRERPQNGARPQGDAGNRPQNGAPQGGEKPQNGASPRGDAGNRPQNGAPQGGERPQNGTRPQGDAGNRPQNGAPQGRNRMQGGARPQSGTSPQTGTSPLNSAGSQGAPKPQTGTRPQDRPAGANGERPGIGALRNFGRSQGATSPSQPTGGAGQANRPSFNRGSGDAGRPTVPNAGSMGRPNSGQGGAPGNRPARSSSASSSMLDSSASSSRFANLGSNFGSIPSHTSGVNSIRSSFPERSNPIASTSGTSSLSHGASRRNVPGSLENVRPSNFGGSRPSVGSLDSVRPSSLGDPSHNSPGSLANVRPNSFSSSSHSPSFSRSAPVGPSFGGSAGRSAGPLPGGHMGGGPGGHMGGRP